MKRIAGMLVLLTAVCAGSEALAKNDSFEKAVRYYLKKDFRHAAENLKQYIAERPDPAAYYLLGYASYKLKRFDEANAYFAEAYLIDPAISPKTERLLKENH